jgi:hypothetical protein
LTFLEILYCTNRQLVNFKSSLLLKIIYKCTKHQMPLQFNANTFTSIKVIKTHMYRNKVIKNVKLSKAWIRLKRSIVLGLMK